MVGIRVISDTIVGAESCENGLDRVKIHLTPWDLFFLRTEYAQRALIFPQADPETHMISQLKSSLSVALKIFYPFAGRLVKIHNEDDETASFFVDCDGSGVKFVHAAAKTISVSDVLDPANDDAWSEFFPANGVESWEGVSEPLLALQVTELKDGVFIGYGVNHMVADGTSFWSFFFKSWTEIFSARWKTFYHPLHLRPWFLDGIDYPIRVPISETVSSPPVEGVVASSDHHLSRKVIFRFTSRHISELKAKANYEVVVFVGYDLNISSFQAVLAHMWLSVIRNSDLNPEEVIHCKLAMEMRQRLNPSIEKECFGNMVGLATSTTTAGEMLKNGLGWTVLQLNKTVGSKTNEEFKRVAENRMKNHKIESFGGE
ncbi:hypothetical protein Bca4012_066623 [Brassica carinata]